MELEERMTRIEWLVQFIFTLLVILVVGLMLGFAVRFAFPSIENRGPSLVGALMLILPEPLSSQGVLMGFVYTIIGFFIIGARPAKKRRTP